MRCTVDRGMSMRVAMSLKLKPSLFSVQTRKMAAAFAITLMPSERAMKIPICIVMQYKLLHIDEIEVNTYRYAKQK